jgi:hypothetical protein
VASRSIRSPGTFSCSDPAGAQLVTIDVATGAATPVGAARVHRRRRDRLRHDDEHALRSRRRNEPADHDRADDRAGTAVGVVGAERRSRASRSIRPRGSSSRRTFDPCAREPRAALEDRRRDRRGDGDRTTRYFDVHGLAFDRELGEAVRRATADPARLLAIDETTGSASAIGDVGFDDVADLAFDSSRGKIYGADRATSQLITIDPATNVGTPSGRSDEAVDAISLRPNAQVLYGTAA